MMKKERLTMFLTAFSLLSMLAIQVYFLRSDYLANEQAFKNDVNASMELIIADVQNDREDRKYELHKRDLMDSMLLRIEYEPPTEYGTSISLIDLTSNDKVLGFKFVKPFDPDTMTKEALFTKLFGWNKKRLTGGRNYLGVGEEIDGRMAVYRDTLSANRKLLDSLLKERFIVYDIKADYEVVYLPKDSTHLKQNGEVVSAFFQLDDKRVTSEVGVIILQPFWDIVRRSRSVIIASFSVFLLIIGSFWFLNSVIRKQRSLAENKDDFIDNVTHELLTPISTLSISLESLDRYNALDDKKKAKDYLKISKMELSRITGLVQNVLQVSLHDQAELKLNVTNVDLNLVLHELIDYYAIKTGDSVLLEIESSGSALVRADIYHISNVLYNLVDNAMNYSNRKPHSVSFKLEVGNDIILEIKDNGYGIPKSDQEKIFDKFHRVSQNGLHEVKGMGIGLYYAKTVMNKMRGDLKLKESSESGSTFCLSFQNADRESNG